MQHGHGMNSQNVPMFTFSYEQAREMNIAFAHAMIAAREAGLESRANNTYGPKLDNAPFMPTHFERSPLMSVMTSSAALCADDCDNTVNL